MKSNTPKITKSGINIQRARLIASRMIVLCVFVVSQSANSQVTCGPSTPPPSQPLQVNVYGTPDLPTIEETYLLKKLCTMVRDKVDVKFDTLLKAAKNSTNDVYCIDTQCAIKDQAARLYYDNSSSVGQHIPASAIQQLIDLNYTGNFASLILRIGQEAGVVTKHEGHYSCTPDLSGFPGPVVCEEKPLSYTVDPSKSIVLFVVAPGLTYNQMFGTFAHEEAHRLYSSDLEFKSHWIHYIKDVLGYELADIQTALAACGYPINIDADWAYNELLGFFANYMDTKVCSDAVAESQTGGGSQDPTEPLPWEPFLPGRQDFSNGTVAIRESPIAPQTCPTYLPFQLYHDNTGEPYCSTNVIVGGSFSGVGYATYTQFYQACYAQSCYLDVDNSCNCSFTFC
ncbi:MAG: hypothetical protein COT74_01885 [Bdellovibrionales bacterium CG10_big_fil_rev_8_21_14_0_10_45_34]|nr:MAG: hypothetical protein COT74_01885 [Bdellovibrionales bacterium CG10_big_fil_rev_8_21_14_0_10_45_34]